MNHTGTPQSAQPDAGTPRRSCARRKVLPLLTLLLATAACQTSVLPRGRPTHVRVENHQTRPTQYFGFLTLDHPEHPPGAPVPAAHKQIPSELMDEVLRVLEEDGFSEVGVPTAVQPTTDPAPILRRLVVSIGDQHWVMTVPQRPDPALADRFTRMSRKLGELFNQWTYLRHDEGLRDPHLFESERKELRDRNQALLERVR